MAAVPFSTVTPDDIVTWKSKYGNESLREVNVNASDFEHKFIIRKPCRSVMNVLSDCHVKKLPTNQMNNILINNCVLAGDMSVLENDGGVYMHVLNAICSLIETPKRNLKRI